MSPTRGTTELLAGDEDLLDADTQGGDVDSDDDVLLTVLKQAQGVHIPQQVLDTCRKLPGAEKQREQARVQDLEEQYARLEQALVAQKYPVPMQEDQG